MGFCKWPEPGLFPGIRADYTGRLVFAVTEEEVYESGPVDQSPRVTGNTKGRMGVRDRLYTTLLGRSKIPRIRNFLKEVWVDLVLALSPTCLTLGKTHHSAGQ